MEMIWDPAAAPARFKPARILEATDDRGKNLLPLPAPADAPADTDDIGPEFSLLLQPPSPAATKLTVLRGYVPLVLPKTRATIAFEAPADGATATSGDLTCKVTALDVEQHRLVLQLSSKKLKPEALEALDYTVRVALKGWESSRASLTKTSRTEHAVEVLINYEPLKLKDGPLKPQEELPPHPTVERVELSVITSTQDKRVPFEFRDLKIR
jgi:hypothetical protein